MTPMQATSRIALRTRCRPWLVAWSALVAFGCGPPGQMIIDKDLGSSGDLLVDVVEDGWGEHSGGDAREGDGPVGIEAEVLPEDARPEAEVCTPSCQDRECGDDGCGGACGACEEYEKCTVPGECMCAPACAGKACGHDGCGGLCGECDAGQTCVAGDCTGCPDPVLLEDVALEAVILEATGAVDEITAEDLSSLSSMEAIEAGISSLSGLQCAVNLKALNLAGNQIADITPVGSLLNLDTLVLTDNKVADLSPLAALPGLTTLVVSSNSVPNLTPLAKSWSLTTLEAALNDITTVSALEHLTNLQNLNLAGNKIADLTPLSPLTSLTVLELHTNDIADLAPLAGLISLQKLILHHNQITDLTPLLENSGLGDLIDIRFNPLDCEAQADNIADLQERGVQVLSDCE